MSQSSFHERGLLDFLAKPLTLLPLGAGLSLFIVAWVKPGDKTLLVFLGVAGVLLALGMLVTQWLFSAGDPRLMKSRQEFAESLETACRKDSPLSPQESKLTATAALAESP